MATQRLSKQLMVSGDSLDPRSKLNSATLESYISAGLIYEGLAYYDKDVKAMKFIKDYDELTGDFSSSVMVDSSTLDETLAGIDPSVFSHPPRINEDGYWEIWDSTLGRYVQTVKAIGQDGSKGEPGQPGKDGSNGVSTYLHIAWANSLHPDYSDFTVSNNGSEIYNFMGILTDNSSDDSTDPKKYKWASIKGKDGSNGIDGQNGTFTHIAWCKSDLAGLNPDFSTFSVTKDKNDDSYDYMGVCVDKNESDPTDYTKYTWNRIKGEKGENGSSVQIKGSFNSVDDLATVVNPSLGDGYIINGDLWVYTGVTNSTYGFENAGHIEGPQGPIGPEGPRGPQGDNITNVVHWYELSLSKIIPPTTWTYTEYVAPTKLKPYLWKKITCHYGDTGSVDSSPWVTDTFRTGNYTWIRYADTSAGDGMSDVPYVSGKWKSYIGFAYNQETQTEGNDPSAYVWTNFKGSTGPQGIPGPQGNDGKSTYTWIKYADYLDNLDSSGLTNNPNTPIYDFPGPGTKYIGILPDQDSSTESNDATVYRWSKFMGDDGVPGVGVKSMEEYYLADASATGVTRLNRSGWTRNVTDSNAQISKSKPYLWNYTKTILGNGVGNDSSTYTDAVMIGTFSDASATVTGFVLNPYYESVQISLDSSKNAIEDIDLAYTVAKYVNGKFVQDLTSTEMTSNSLSLEVSQRKNDTGVWDSSSFNLTYDSTNKIYKYTGKYNLSSVNDFYDFAIRINETVGAQKIKRDERFVKAQIKPTFIFDVDKELGKIGLVIGDVSGRVNTMEINSSGWSTKLTQHDSSINSALTRIGQVEATASGFTTRFAAIDSSVNGVETQVSNLSQDASGFRLSIARLDGSVSDVSTHLTEVVANINGISSRVTDVSTIASQALQTANSFETRVTDASNKASQALQTVNGFKTTVEDASGKSSQALQTVNSFMSIVNDSSNKSALALQTVNGFETRVTDASNKASQALQTANGFETRVSDLESGMNSVVSQTANQIIAQVANSGLIIDSSSVTLKGDVRATNFYFFDTKDASVLDSSVPDVAIMKNMWETTASDGYLINGKRYRPIIAEVNGIDFYTVQDSSLKEKILNQFCIVQFDRLKDSSSANYAPIGGVTLNFESQRIDTKTKNYSWNDGVFYIQTKEDPTRYIRKRLFYSNGLSQCDSIKDASVICENRDHTSLFEGTIVVEENKSEEYKEYSSVVLQNPFIYDASKMGFKDSSNSDASLPYKMQKYLYDRIDKSYYTVGYEYGSPTSMHLMNSYKNWNDMFSDRIHFVTELNKKHDVSAYNFYKVVKNLEGNLQDVIFDSYGPNKNITTMTRINVNSELYWRMDTNIRRPLGTYLSETCKSNESYIKITSSSDSGINDVDTLIRVAGQFAYNTGNFGGTTFTDSSYQSILDSSTFCYYKDSSVVQVYPHSSSKAAKIFNNVQIANSDLKCVFEDSSVTTTSTDTDFNNAMKYIMLYFGRFGKVKARDFIYNPGGLIATDITYMDSLLFRKDESDFNEEIPISGGKIKIERGFLKQSSKSLIPVSDASMEDFYKSGRKMYLPLIVDGVSILTSNYQNPFWTLKNGSDDSSIRSHNMLQLGLSKNLFGVTGMHKKGTENYVSPMYDLGDRFKRVSESFYQTINAELGPAAPGKESKG